ncbi:MAG: hypothetical protein R2821_11650 [Flavobacteriaceae bacterium]
MFNFLQHTITGWPGGKPNVMIHLKGLFRLRSELSFLALIRMMMDINGTFDRLIEVMEVVMLSLYQTSGNIAVSDDEAMKFAEVTKALNNSSDI